jgi:hypothetical protein
VPVGAATVNARSVDSRREPASFRQESAATTFALLIVAAGTVCAREYIDDYATNRLLLAMHEWTGLTLLAMIVFIPATFSSFTGLRGGFPRSGKMDAVNQGR